MSKEYEARVFESEIDAIRESRSSDRTLFKYGSGDKVIWVVAVSEYQAQLALVNKLGPLTKINKRDRDWRWPQLLEEQLLQRETAWFDGTQGDTSEQQAEE